MPKTIRDRIAIALWVFSLLLPVATRAQETTATIDLAAFLVRLEEQYDIKFSFVDEDVKGISLVIPGSDDLGRILQNLEKQTQLLVNKLNNRYYTIVKKTLVTVCGRVLDNYAENNIPGATVEVLGDELAIVTDKDGRFQLDQIPRKASLRIRYFGYTTKIIGVNQLLNNQDCTTILMAEKVEQLEEVVVYDFLTPGIKKQEDASILLDTEALGLLPGVIEPDVLQVVQALPGIKSIDETVSDINVRGGTNDQNLILWNGIKMYQSGHFFGLISAFNPYLTDKVIVYKNGTPAQYGDGVSSVISMETKNEIEDNFIGGAGLNFLSGDIFGQVPVGRKTAFQFSARRSTTDFLNTRTYNNFTDRVFQDTEIRTQQNQTVDRQFSRDIKFFFYDFAGKLLYDVNEDHKLRFSFIGLANDLDYQETLIENDETSTSFLEQTNISAGLRWMGQWNQEFTTHLNVYFSRYNLDAQSFFPNQIQRLNQKNIVEERAIKFQSIYRLSNLFSWHNGYQYVETGIINRVFNVLPAFNQNVKGVVRIQAPFTALHYQTSNNSLFGMFGLRVNRVENLNTFTKWLVEPRINLNFKLANYLRAEVLGEFKSQSTNQVVDLEQNFLGVEKRRWTLSNEDDLPLTKSRQGAVGINYARNRLYIGLEGFYKHVDGVSTRTQGFQSQNLFNGELGSYEVKGVELLINKKGDRYSTWLSYTYNKNDYTYDSIVPSTFPNNLDVRHSLTFASTYDIKRLKLGLGINYRTGNPYTRPFEGDAALDLTTFPAQINFETPNSSRLPEYFRVDASAKYDFLLGQRTKASFAVSLLNLTNRRNILNRYYRVNDANELEQVENFSLGLTPNISFRIRF